VCELARQKPLESLQAKKIDKTTNSAVEGYRLVDFDRSPETLKSIESFLESLSSDKSSKLNKKSRRMLYQKLTGDEFLQHLFDLHLGLVQTPESYTTHEYLEILMHEIFKLLCKLSVSCHLVKIPQKWIGSSLAIIGFDSGVLPPRSQSEDEYPQERNC